MSYPLSNSFKNLFSSSKVSASIFLVCFINFGLIKYPLISKGLTFTISLILASLNAPYNCCHTFVITDWEYDVRTLLCEFIMLLLTYLMGTFPNGKHFSIMSIDSPILI